MYSLLELTIQIQFLLAEGNAYRIASEFLGTRYSIENYNVGRLVGYQYGLYGGR